MSTKTHKKEKLPFRVIKNGLEPADHYTVERLRARKYHIGDLIFAELTKPRNPQFNKLVHQFGALVAENIEGFSGLAAHDVLKRLQLEGNIKCSEITLIFPGMGPCAYRVPDSLSFESMDQGEFEEVFTAFCRYVSDKYWPGMEEKEIKRLAEIMD